MTVSRLLRTMTRDVSNRILVLTSSGCLFNLTKGYAALTWPMNKNTLILPCPFMYKREWQRPFKYKHALLHCQICLLSDGVPQRPKAKGRAGSFVATARYSDQIRFCS
jgi:hypothetical protein